MPVKRIFRKISFFLPGRSKANSAACPPRQHPRIALATDVRVEGHDFAFTARSVQLGTKGMALQDADQLRLAMPVQLTFALPSGCRLRIGAVVWWKRDELIGLRFDPRDNYPAIEEWIEAQKDPAPSRAAESHLSAPPSATCVAQKG